MKALYERWTAISLPKRILGGMILGAVLGMVIPQAVGISILGNLFVNALKGIAPLLVFFLVISSLCQAKQSHGGIIRTVVCLYLFNTLLGAVIAVVASKLFPITLTLAQAAEETSAPQGIAEVLQTLLLNVVKNPITSIAEANYIGILAWAVLFGVAMRGASERTKEIMDNFAAALSKVVTWIINFAPFGILGLVFDTVSTNGLQVFTEYGRLLAVLVGSMLFIYFVTNPILVYWCIRQNPFPLIFKCLKRSAVTAFFTRSSAANIPINMEVCEEMGLDMLRHIPAEPRAFHCIVAGQAPEVQRRACLHCLKHPLAAANTLGIPVDIPTAIILSVLSALSACGASGVAGGSLLLIPLACSLFGISSDVAMQVIGVGFIIGVVQDSVETALNSSCDLLLSAAAQFREWRKEGREITY